MTNPYRPAQADSWKFVVDRPREEQEKQEAARRAREQAEQRAREEAARLEAQRKAQQEQQARAKEEAIRREAALKAQQKSKEEQQARAWEEAGERIEELAREQSWSEPQKQATRFYLTKLTTCGKLWYVQAKQWPLTQFHRLSVALIPEPVTEANRLKGIEWHGRAYLHAPYRFYDPPKNQWSEWSDPVSPSGLSLQGPVALLVIHGTKKRGKWEFKSGHEVEILSCIPAVQGLFWREAKATLERYGLRVGELSREHSESVARGNVIAQSPPADSTLMKGGAVSLVVSDGPTPVSYTMPDLRGQPQDVANKMVASIGLRVEKVSYTDRPDAPAGSVVAQRPLPGHKVAAGEGVALVLAKRETTPPGSASTFALFQHRLPAGAGPRRVQVVIMNAEENRQIFDEIRDAGAEVRLLVKVQGETNARIYYDGVLVEERRIE